jgi:molybdopterin-synthase adenylyltransferase
MIMAIDGAGGNEIHSTDPLDRYSRQVRFPQLGEAGQRKVMGSRVTICGCGALGTVLANHLVRAGVGHVRIVDRDFIETHNLQRQILFDEDDVASNLPKAEAAARKLRKINSSVEIEAVVTDIDHTNILELVADADLILDGTDNFETRYLINDAAVKLNKPWIFGGVIGSEGQSMTIRPGITPCLRCLIEDSPPPGMTPTCETAGVLGPAVAVIASFEAVEAIKLLSGAYDALNVELIMVDVWDWNFRRLKVAGLLGKVDCPCCQHHKFEWLAGDLGSHTTTLCGRNAVQVAARRPEPLDFPEMARRLAPLGEVRHNAFMLRFAAEGHDFTVFPDGRAIIKGTNDIARARTLYSQFVGS